MGKRKDVRMIQKSGSEQANEKVFRETWNVLKCLDMETIFKPKESCKYMLNKTDMLFLKD